MMFSKLFGIVLVQHLSQYSGTEATTPNLLIWMKNMAATWYEGKVNSAENLSCIVVTSNVTNLDIFCEHQKKVWAYN